jgi:hypothetical protein
MGVSFYSVAVITPGGLTETTSMTPEAAAKAKTEQAQLKTSLEDTDA